jgi:hypothetical protein
MMRGVTYRCPPVPFKLGQRMLDAYTDSLSAAQSVVMDGSNKVDSDRYFKRCRQMSRMLWSHIRPAGRARRFCRWIGITRNPFMQISEKELVEVVDFFLQGRTKSSAQFMSELPDPVLEF